MTLINEQSTVVYEVAIGVSPLAVGEDDDRTDAELIDAIDSRTTVTDMSWPDWTVFTNEPHPNDRENLGYETVRYVDTETRINVRAVYGETYDGHKYERDVFDEITDRVEIDGADGLGLSHWGATHEDDFEGEIHLDLTDQ